MLLDRLDSPSATLSSLECLPPPSDKAFRRLDNAPSDDENAEANHACFKKLCELLKRHGSHRSHTQGFFCRESQKMWDVGEGQARKCQPTSPDLTAHTAA
jgi:hypothetical protein